MKQRPYKILAVLAFLFIAGWFLFFTGAGLRAAFSGDDLMNLHQHLLRSFPSMLLSIVTYWSSEYRPMGGLFYRSIYHVFVFDPLPFRIACFALLSFNLTLVYRFCRLLSGSGEVGALATLFASYHARFVDLYYSSGTVYDLLCFAFYFSAFVFYVRIRQQGRFLSGPRDWLPFAGLYVASLNSKEMAVTLPLLIGIYEWLYFRPKVRLSAYLRWLGREGRCMLLTALLTVPYVVGKLTGPESLSNHPLYRPSISPGRFLDTFHLYLNPLFYREHFFRDANTVQLLLSMLLLAVLGRSRPLLFAWSFLLCSILPVAFISHYSAFFLYIPVVGWVLFVAVTIVMIRDFVIGLLRRAGLARVVAQTRTTTIAQVLTFLTLAACIAPLNAREGTKALKHFQNVQPPSREMAAELARIQPTIPKGGSILFVDDPFDKDKYFLTFLARLYYNDMNLRVDRTVVDPVLASDYGKYDAVLVFRKGRLQKVR